MPIAPHRIVWSLLLVLIIGCGAQPGDPKPDPTPAPDPSLPSYQYMDTTGSTYVLSQQKLIYTPASSEDTVDGVPDEGYYTELNITRNDYAKIAAAFEQQFDREQEPFASDNPARVLPRLSRSGGEGDAPVIDLDAKAARDLDYILEPYLND